VVKEIRYHPRAVKSLARHRADAAKIISKISEYATNAATRANNVKRLKGKPVLYRLRVGDYRVIFAQTVDTLTVTKIEPRGSVYD
jgi:mRNA interferase RelE/StbE